ncbi:PilN domain-containing protein [Bradyrhizobium sp. STM 3809]|uniref:PilN domain-containing protein n=1 Tax=Bradyrhizobium sp. STM 3809 TaxID=551936 RepID=UPI00024091FF|nr:PilN domain-containing protein [Bradyrhizobium sp. STM 3809]CCE00357.1 putative General secretion pathway protein L [Bradyrhizobium sp. STM 3809]
MSLVERIRRELGSWIGTVAAVTVDRIGRFDLRPPIQLIETERNVFLLRMIARAGRSAPPDCHVRLPEGGPAVPALPDGWHAALRGSRIDLVLMPDRFLSRPLDLPRRAAEFLDAMVRSQLDRLTPWTAQEAVFGHTAPVAISGDRIRTTVIAAPRTRLDPLVRLAESWHVGSVVLFAAAGTAPPAAAGQPVAQGATRLTEQHLRGSLDVGRVGRMLTSALVIAAVSATLSFVTASILGGQLDTQQSLLSRRISERRAALRLDLEGTDNAALRGLLRRKQETAADVLVLDALSRVLPDNTYVTELRIEKDRLQIAGVSQDAPALVRLIEQSAHFTRATFSAPTTRSADDPGERFHIEAGIKPHFGPGT